MVATWDNDRRPTLLGRCLCIVLDGEVADLGVEASRPQQIRQ